MTLQQFGKKVRELRPKTRDVPLNDEALALQTLSHYPAYWDLIDPVQQKLKEISGRSFESSAWFEETRVRNISQMIANARSEVMLAHEIQMVSLAAEHGVPVAALPEIAVESHKTQQQIKLMEAQRDIGLAGMDRQNHFDYRAEQLEAQIFDLIERRDKEQHADKKRILEKRISVLEEELNGLARMVQTRNRERFSSSDENTESSGSGVKSEASDVQQVPTSKPGMGFRPGGDSH